MLDDVMLLLELPVLLLLGVIPVLLLSCVCVPSAGFVSTAVDAAALVDDDAAAAENVVTDCCVGVGSNTSLDACGCSTL